MKTSKQARREAKGLFQSCLVNGLLDEHRVRQAVRTVIAKRPRGYLAMLSYFERLVKLDLARRSARVESPADLTPAIQAAIRASLARRYGPGLSFSFVPNPALIAGLRVRVGSDVYDGSIRGRLAALQGSF